MRNTAGFTLIEIMIVVAVLGILVAIAYPSYMERVREGRRTDGHAALLEAAALQERFFTINNSFTGTINNIGGSSSAEGYYTISVDVSAGTTGCAAANDCFVLTAAAIGPQEGDVGCTSMTLSHTGIKAPAGCW